MKWRRGFTVVEVMILILIIAFLLVMIIPALQRIRQDKANRNGTAPDQTAPAHT